jgi:hypothetical protein
MSVPKWIRRDLRQFSQLCAIGEQPWFDAAPGAGQQSTPLDIRRSARYNARLAPVPFCVWLVTKLVRHQGEVKSSHLTSRGPARVTRPHPLGRLPHDIARPVWVHLDDGAGLAL